MTSNDTMSGYDRSKDSGGMAVGVVVSNNRITAESRAYITDRAFNDYASFDYREIEA